MMFVAKYLPREKAVRLDQLRVPFVGVRRRISLGGRCWRLSAVDRHARVPDRPVVRDGSSCWVSSMLVGRTVVADVVTIRSTPTAVWLPEIQCDSVGRPAAAHSIDNHRNNTMNASDLTIARLCWRVLLMHKTLSIQKNGR